MRLCRIAIKNFRCIEEAEISVYDYTSLIGPNNSGKSAVLRAVEVILNQLKLERDEWHQGHKDESIVIEADFEDLQEWERNRPGVSGLVYDDAIKLRRTIPPSDEGQPRARIDTEYAAYKPVETIEGWSDKWPELDSAIKEMALERISGLNGNEFKKVSTRERVRKLVRDNMSGRVDSSAPRWTSEGVSIAAALKQALPQAQLIPAVRDAADDAKPGAKTSFGLLLKSVLLPAIKASEEYQSLIRAVTSLDKRLRAEDDQQLPEVKNLTEEISKRLADLIAARVTLGMDPPDAEKFIGSNTVLGLDDGTPTRIGLQGHGLQRALVFALLEVLAQQDANVSAEGESEARSCGIVLLFEEPELFIHPQLMRRLKASLEKLSKRPGWQLILSTHSPIMVDVATDPRALVIHRRASPVEPPRLTQLDHDPFADGEEREQERETLRAMLDFHPTVCEAFFAKHAVLVEGDSEVAVLLHRAKLWELAGIDGNATKDITVVSCAGKWTIAPVARLLREFQIPVRVIHDKDAKGRSSTDLAALTGFDAYCANARLASIVDTANILVVEDTLEDILWPDGDRPQGSDDKPFRAWRRVGVLCEGKSDLNHVPRLRDMLKFAFVPASE
ncbi:MAG: AAA family ATPase [Planctomycetes bacterium]|nr:AAA family ATPase [Planctomycetota bacterium]